MIDYTDQVLIRVLHNVVPENILQITETVVNKYQHLTSNVSDVRGLHNTTNFFRSYIEQGGAGRIITSKQPFGFEQLLQEIEEIGLWVNGMFSYLFPEVSTCVEKVPKT